MKVIKNINNNVAICVDDNGHEVVAMGKGIGFSKPPYEVDLSKIDRTYYSLDSHYVTLLSEIPEEVIDVTLEIVEKYFNEFAGIPTYIAFFLLFENFRQYSQAKKFPW